MDFKEYHQFIAELQKSFPQSETRLAQLAMSLGIESGEAAQHIYKHLRDGKELDEEALIKELGDLLAFISALSDYLGFTLADVAEVNVAKLAARKAKGTLQGSGDNR